MPTVQKQAASKKSTKNVKETDLKSQKHELNAENATSQPKKKTKVKKEQVKVQDPASKQKEATPEPSSQPTKKSADVPQTMDELLAEFGDELSIPKKDTVVTGIITAIGRKTLRVDIGAKTEGIVADKEFDIAQDYIAELKVGEEVEAVVLSSENNQGQVVLSMKRAAVDAKWEFFENALDKNEILEAKGIEVNKGGLIVLVHGVRGFVPSSQFGKEYVGSFHALKGSTFKVRAIEVDQEKNRLIFSERHVSEEQEIAQKNQALDAVEVGTIYKGTVSGVMHFGLFVTVEVPIDSEETIGHIEGLVHISEISWEKVTHPKEYHRVGDHIDVRVLGVDEKTGKLNLSIKQLRDDPWQDVDQRYQPGTTVEGTVSRIEPFGVFVNVEKGVDGLIHSSKLDSSVLLERGKNVTVHIETVDPLQRRMSLSLVTHELPIEYK